MLFQVMGKNFKNFIHGQIKYIFFVNEDFFWSRDSLVHNVQVDDVIPHSSGHPCHFIVLRGGRS